MYTVQVVTAERDNSGVPKTTHFKYDYTDIRSARRRYNNILRGLFERMIKGGFVYKFKMVLVDGDGKIYRKAMVDNGI